MATKVNTSILKDIVESTDVTMIFNLESKNLFLLSADMWHRKELSVDLGSKAGGIKEDQPEGCRAKMGQHLLGRLLDSLTCMDRIINVVS